MLAEMLSVASAGSIVVPMVSVADRGSIAGAERRANGGAEEVEVCDL